MQNESSVASATEFSRRIQIYFTFTTCVCAYTVFCTCGGLKGALDGTSEPKDFGPSGGYSTKWVNSISQPLN